MSGGWGVGGWGMLLVVTAAGLRPVELELAAGVEPCQGPESGQQLPPRLLGGGGGGGSSPLAPVSGLNASRLVPSSAPSGSAWSSWAGSSLASEPELASVALSTSEEKVTVAYPPGPGPHHNNNNNTNPVDSNLSSSSYLASLAPGWNSSSPSWSQPFWDCVLRKWIFGYISPTPDGRGVLGFYYLLDKVELDQCDESLSPLFAEYPKCDTLTTKCVPESGNGKGRFHCVCLPGFTTPPLDTFVDEYDLHFHTDVQNGEPLLYRCVPSCGNGTLCSAQPHFLLKTIVISVQIFCMGFTIAVGFVIFKRRKCKPVATGMWTILETLLLGILLLYGAVVLQSFEPSIERCITERWVRELGFIICYGAIILKLYRILMEFRTRKAHRWVIRDKDLLKYLCGMVMIMFCYLSAWTATNLNFIKEGFSIVATGRTTTGEYFQTCKPLWWDYITQAGEIVILLFGLHLGVAARNATIQFIELRYLVCAIIIETVNSSLYYIVHAAMWNSLHPDHTYLASFMRCHFTSTLVLILVFLPTILFNHKPVRDSRHHLTHEPSDAYKPQDGLYSDIDVAEVNLSDMNPEEIRAELKRLYTQLEILKNKTIRQNNPHISKRRGGRKVAHRRFSLQKKGSREKALQQKQKCPAKPPPGESSEAAAEQEVSRTPEDSVCSMEGPSAIYNDGPSTYSELCSAGPAASQNASSKQ